MNFKSIAAGALLGMLAITSADARELRFAGTGPETSPFGKLVSQLSERVAELSAGELTLKVFHGSALGDEQTALRQTVRGRIDMMGASTTAQTLIVPEYALLAEPFVFANAEERYCVEDNHLSDIYDARFAEAGIVRLGYLDIGFETIFSQTPIKVPADMQGLKLRTPPTTSQERFASELGASVVTSGVSEIVPNLKTGAVNAATTVTMFGIAIGVAELAPHMTNIGAIQTSAALVISKKVWDTLSAEEQTWLQQAADEVLPGFRKTITGTTNYLVGKAIEGGATVYEPNAEELALWRAAAEESRKAGIVEFGEQGAQDWDALKAAVASCNS